jgi:hypothetical protein
MFALTFAAFTQDSKTPRDVFSGADSTEISEVFSKVQSIHKEFRQKNPNAGPTEVAVSQFPKSLISAGYDMATIAKFAISLGSTKHPGVTIVFSFEPHGRIILYDANSGSEKVLFEQE